MHKRRQKSGIFAAALAVADGATAAPLLILRVKYNSNHSIHTDAMVTKARNK